ncbi:MAG TPA: DMT family transporter [Aliiroseovarius sp.]|nr:DMT family transporter [Aliiroseovarius sp.]
MTVRNTNLVGILSALTASLFFTINDTVIKFLSGEYALHQVVFFRSLIAFLILALVFVPLMGGYQQIRTKRLRLHLLRGAFVVFANLTFFLGLAALPIAETTAIFFVAPLIITAFSVVFLGEYVGPHRWGAVVMGMIGVLVIVRPGSDSFQLAALLPLAAAFGYAGLHILTRRIGTTDSAVAMAFYIQLVFIVVSLVFGLIFGSGQFTLSSSASLEFLTRAWGQPAIGDIKLFLLVGIASAVGGFFISQAYKLCEAGPAAPFEYVAMPLSVFWGAVVFNEWPDSMTWIGIVLILSSGLYMAWRELIASNSHPGGEIRK